MDPITVMRLSKIRYDEMLQTAANERRARANGRAVPGLPARLLSTIGDALISTGRKLKIQRRSGSATPSTHVS